MTLKVHTFILTYKHHRKNSNHKYHSQIISTYLTWTEVSENDYKINSSI